MPVLVFEEKTFGGPKEEEERLFTTLRTFDSLYNTCQNHVTLNGQNSFISFFPSRLSSIIKVMA